MGVGLPLCLEKAVKVGVQVDTGAYGLGFVRLILGKQGQELAEDFPELGAVVEADGGGQGTLQEIDVKIMLCLKYL